MSPVQKQKSRWGVSGVFRGDTCQSSWELGLLSLLPLSSLPIASIFGLLIIAYFTWYNYQHFLEFISSEKKFQSKELLDPFLTTSPIYLSPPAAWDGTENASVLSPLSADFQDSVSFIECGSKAHPVILWASPLQEGVTEVLPVSTAPKNSSSLSAWVPTSVELTAVESSASQESAERLMLFLHNEANQEKTSSF